MVKNNFKICGKLAMPGSFSLLLTGGCLLLTVITGCQKEESAPIPAQKVKKPVAAVLAPMTTVIKEVYTYNPEGKRDPFKPFIELEKKKVDQVHVQAVVPTTPLQIYELTDLRLVGVIILPGKRVAMIEDPTGKGYHIKEGTLLGKGGGRVIEIRKDEVVVEEKYSDEMAQTKTKRVSIKIPREQGGEGR